MDTSVYWDTSSVQHEIEIEEMKLEPVNICEVHYNNEGEPESEKKVLLPDDHSISLVYDEIGYCYVKDRVEGDQQLLRCVKFICPAMYSGLIPMVHYRPLTQLTGHNHSPEPDTMKVLVIRREPGTIADKRCQDSLSISPDLPPAKRKTVLPTKNLLDPLLTENQTGLPAGEGGNIELAERNNIETLSKSSAEVISCDEIPPPPVNPGGEEKQPVFDETLKNPPRTKELGNKVGNQSGARKDKKHSSRRQKSGPGTRPYCLYCKSFILHEGFLSHVTKHHKDEKEITELLSLPINSSVRRAFIDHLMQKGYKQYLKEFPKENDKQNTSPGGFLPGEYLPCHNCSGFFMKCIFPKHIKHCKNKVNNKQLDALHWLLNQEKKYKLLEKHVFPTMIDDEISLIIRSDYLISHCGAKFYNETKNEEVVTVMRWLGKLLFDLRMKHGKERSLASFINPNDYPLIKGVIQEMCGSNTIPFRLHHYLFQCAGILERKGLALSDNELVETSRKFKNVFNPSSINVNTELDLANASLSENSCDSDHS